VSSQSGTAQLNCSTSKTLRNFKYWTRSTGESTQTIQVDSTSLNDFFKNNSQTVDLIKIDIEGWEFEAIKGMSNLIKHNASLKIFLEFNPYTLTRSGTNIPKFIDFIIQAGFIFFNIDEKKKEKNLVDKTWLLKYAKNTEGNHYTNLLCIKKLKIS